MGRWVVVIGVMGALLACSSPEDMAQDVAPAQAETSQRETAQGEQEQSDPANAKPVKFTDNEEVTNGGREFAYAWPAQVSAIPALAAELEAQRDDALREQKAYWQESLKDCPEDASTCRNASYDLTWQVVANLPGYLSLSNGFSSYSGGAHGIYGHGSLVWDRTKGVALEPLQLFTGAAALESALGKAACDALNAERAKRRGGPVNSGSGDWFNECVGMDDTVLFIGSSTGKAFDRIGVYYGPYVAGSYAEGDFEFTLPVTKAVLDAVKPEYRSVFAVAQ